MKTVLHSIRKCLCLLAFALAFYYPSYSQLSAGNYFEAGVTAGPMVFLGDLGGHYGVGTTFLKDYNMNATKLWWHSYYSLSGTWFRRRNDHRDHQGIPWDPP